MDKRLFWAGFLDMLNASMKWEDERGHFQQRVCSDTDDQRKEKIIKKNWLPNLTPMLSNRIAFSHPLSHF